MWRGETCSFERKVCNHRGGRHANLKTEKKGRRLQWGRNYPTPIASRELRQNGLRPRATITKPPEFQRFGTAQSRACSSTLQSAIKARRKEQQLGGGQFSW